MDLQEATLEMAKLFKKEKEFYNKHVQGKAPKNQIELTSFNAVLHKFEILKAQTREFGNELAALPNFFDVLEPWKVVVKGKGGISLTEMKASINNTDIDNLIEKTGGMASGVKDFFKLNGYYICDMGVGEDGWDVAAVCNDKDAKDLCEVLHQKYTRAIHYGLISVSRRFNGQHYLPGLYNWEDAERLLSLYGD